MKKKKSLPNYNTELDEESKDSLMTVEEFKTCVENLVFGPDDGWGHAVKDELEDISFKIYADDDLSEKIPADATHISWYNK